MPYSRIVQNTNLGVSPQTGSQTSAVHSLSSTAVTSLP